MSGLEFPSDVRAFIERHLTSAAQLEVLLLLHGDRDRPWSAVAVGRELRINPDQAHEALARLAEDGLLVYDGSVFRFAPSETRKAELADALAALYPTYRVAIVSLIFSKPNRQIRNFSDAFRLRDED